MNSYKWMVLLWSLAVIMSACGSDGSDDEIKQLSDSIENLRFSLSNSEQRK